MPPALDSGPDPAALAAAEPEAELAIDNSPVYAVGIGPGNREYLTPRGKHTIREADVVVGFETVVQYVSDLTEADLLTCGYEDESETLAAFADRIDAGADGTAVLMGDPNHSGYQFVGKVQAAIDRPVRIIPGISSLQIAASRARTPMEETTFVTLHKSGDIAPNLQQLRADVGDRHLLVLPRPFDWMPEAIAAEVLSAGAAPALDTLVFERLTHEDEAVTQLPLGDLASLETDTGPSESRFSDLSVLAIRADSGD